MITVAKANMGSIAGSVVIQYEGEPPHGPGGLIEDIITSLIDYETGETVDQVKLDSNGNFIFEEVRYGTYTLLAEVSGDEQYTGVPLTLTVDQCTPDITGVQLMILAE